jgi:glucose/arabinose dehydrogenase
MRILAVVLFAALSVVLAACDGDDGDAAAPPTQAPTSIATSAAEASPSPGATAQAVSPSPTAGSSQDITGLPDSVGLERVFPDLSFERLTGLYPTPLNGDLWLATEQVGRVHLIFPGSDASPEPDAGIFLDISSKVSTDGNEEGLLGLALAPDFASSGVFYVYYSAANPRRSVISRFESAGNAALPESETVILEVAQPFSNHNGGQIAFGPDGYLYIGLGDGGSARDPQGNGQNTATLLGSILRIDVSGGEAGYSIPSDNPFVGQGNARGEIWAYGLRNPWRFSFDSTTGDLWVGDVGQNTREEVDVITRGGNYGWSIMEGFDCLDGGDDCNRYGLLPPVIDYGRDGGCSVTGGFIYRGAAIPELVGAYVYADYCSGSIWALRYDGSEVTEHEQIGQADFAVSSFAQGSDGEIYVLEHSGAGGIYKLTP